MTRRAAFLFPIVFTVVAVFALGAYSLPAQAPEKPLTIDTIFAHGPLIGEPPDELTWSPDGKHLTYLDGGELMDVDPATGKTHVLVSAPKMENLNGSNGSEKDRDHRQRYNQASYVWAPDSTHILFDSNGRLWLYDLRNGAGVEMGFTGLLSGDDPKFSPDGWSLSFIKDHGLAVIALREPGTPTVPLTPATNPSSSDGQVLLNGEVDWVYEEELDVRSNYFWSPDSRKIAYLQMNETQVPQYPLTDWIPNHATVDWQRFPQPGDKNPEVHLGVVPASGGKTVWMRVPLHNGDDYVPRFGWVNSKTVWIETLTRDHKHLALFFADAEFGEPRQMLEIRDDKFLDENYDVTVGDGAIVLTNWSDGHNHLYLYSYDKAKPLNSDAKLDRQLTKGDFEVGDAYNVDIARKVVNYTSNENNPLEQQLWQVNFSGERRQLTEGAGFHQVTIAPDGGAFTDKFSSRMSPPVMRVCRVTDKLEDKPGEKSSADSCRVFWETHALDSYHLHPPEQLEMKAHDGTTLYATLLLPEGAMNPGGRLPGGTPLILNPYGGPHDQIVVNQWSGALLFDELMAQHGFAVLHADNQGMGSRGRDFAQAAYRDFGPVQLEDQLTIVDAVLAKYPQLDPKHLGWWGWSWGGTFTVYAMTHSNRFRTGVAVAPVTDWRNYDSIYTERYMGLPADDTDGYRDFSVVNSASDLKGRLLIAHGTGDDNVHFENTVQLVQRLIDAGIPYDLQVFPRKTHSIAGPEAQTQLFSRILAEFETYLKPEAPAAGGN